jgi:phage terminase small subunit
VPILSNQRHEAVALAYIADPQKIGWRAYQSVYSKSSRPAAESGFSRMLRKAKFRARVAELQAGAAADAEITLEGLLREVEEARKMAMSLSQSSAAVAAIKLKSELSGHYVQRKEDVTPRRSVAEIDARLRELLAGGEPAGSFGAAGTAPKLRSPSRLN